MRLPHVTNLAGVDFTIVGVPFDTGGAYRVGARFGPAGIRDQSVLLLYEPGLDLPTYDAGHVPTVAFDFPIKIESRGE